MECPLPKPQAFDPRQAAEVWRRRLPHWQQEGVAYFVTFRLADSLPAQRLLAWREQRDRWLAANPRPHSQEQQRHLRALWNGRIQRWLDAGHGRCLLAQAENANTVEQAMRHFDSQRYLLGDFVVMPNHVHVLFMPLAGYKATQIIGSWKKHSAKGINAREGLAGTLWQREPFDHIVRGEGYYRLFQDYIRNNAKAVPGARVGCGQLQW